MVTPRPKVLATNAASSPSVVQLSGAVCNHLRVSTPDATYAVGLQGLDYRRLPPAVLRPATAAPPHLCTRDGTQLRRGGSAQPLQGRTGLRLHLLTEITARYEIVGGHIIRDMTPSVFIRSSPCIMRPIVLSRGSTTSTARAHRRWLSRHEVRRLGALACLPMRRLPGGLRVSPHEPWMALGFFADVHGSTSPASILVLKMTFVLVMNSFQARSVLKMEFFHLNVFFQVIA